MSAARSAVARTTEAARSVAEVEGCHGSLAHSARQRRHPRINAPRNSDLIAGVLARFGLTGARGWVGRQFSRGQRIGLPPGDPGDRLRRDRDPVRTGCTTRHPDAPPAASFRLSPTSAHRPPLMRLVGRCHRVACPRLFSSRSCMVAADG
jgi:hypothetical protein